MTDLVWLDRPDAAGIWLVRRDGEVRTIFNIHNPECWDCKQGEEWSRVVPFADLERARAVQDIVDERARQIAVEGWSADHDDEHIGGELASAAACYAHYARRKLETVPIWWPWACEDWKQKDQRRDLVRAGALIVAEIERIDRSRASSREGGAR